MSNELIIALVVFANAYILTAVTMLEGPFGIFKYWREGFYNRDQHFWFKLFSCPYCLGFWTSLVWALWTVEYIDSGNILLLWLAYASASATVAEL